MQERMLKTKGLASVTMKTLRERFIKIAAQVRELKTKIKVEFPATCPQNELPENYFLTSENCGVSETLITTIKA